MRTDAPLFLFSVDLEDVRSRFDGGYRYRPRVAAMTHRYLDFLREHEAAVLIATNVKAKTILVFLNITYIQVRPVLRSSAVSLGCVSAYSQ